MVYQQFPVVLFFLGGGGRNKETVYICMTRVLNARNLLQWTKIRNKGVFICTAATQETLLDSKKHNPLPYCSYKYVKNNSCRTIRFISNCNLIITLLTPILGVTEIGKRSKCPIKHLMVVQLQIIQTYYNHATRHKSYCTQTAAFNVLGLGCLMWLQQ